MKKVLRTKLVYNCDKKEDFDYLERKYINVYNRSYDMYVTASTKEDCERLMESFENYIAKEDIQNSFDSNFEPEQNKDGLWVGAVEIYISNEDISEQKEIIKEAYKIWKQSLTNAVEVKENEEMKKEIKVDRIMETTYEDGTSWVEYRTPQGCFGYEITEDYEEGDEEELEKEINKDEVTYNGMLDKKHISQCSDFLEEIIEECRQSDNEMWFVEFRDLEKELKTDEKDIIDNFLLKLQKEVHDLGIKDYITFYEGEIAITVYGGVITKFLF